MAQGDDTARDDAPRETAETAPEDGDARDAALTAAVLRIGASLDLDEVLGEVVASARALTGAAYGVNREARRILGSG